MNERNNTNRLRALWNIAEEKFTGMNKGSKLMLKIGAVVFMTILLASLALSVFFMTGLLRFEGQVQIIQYMVLYSFRFWVMLVFGAFILDILTKK